MMRSRGTVVDDSEVLAELIDRYTLRERDAGKEAERAAACEQDSTPDWLRRAVLARDGHRCRACGVEVTGLHAHHIVFRSRGGSTVMENLISLCAGCHGLVHDGRLFVSGPADAVVFNNRFGERLWGSSAGAMPPSPVLRLLRASSGPAADGGQPPRSDPTLRGRPGLLGEEEIPDPITPEWFREHMHLLEPGRDGVWRIKSSARR